MDFVTSRELASIILLFPVFLWAMTRSEIRSETWSVGRAFFGTKVVVSIVFYSVYLSAWIWLAAQIGLWEPHLLKETLLWFLITEVPLFFTFVRAGQEEHFFRQAVRSTVALSGFVEFFVNITSFRLVIELCLQLVIAFFALMIVGAGIDAKNVSVKRLAETVLLIIGVVLVVLTMLSIYRGRQDIHLPYLGRSLALAIWLPLLALPAIYLFALYSGYELAFMRMKYMNRRLPPSKTARLAVIIGLNGHVRDVHAFVGEWAGRAASAPSVRTARECVREFRDHREAQRFDRIERQDRLQRNAGLVFPSVEGEQLDQREHEATKDALQWLATCHMGWYRRHGGRYRPDLLDRLGGFTSQGLPDDHAIVMDVRGDGQAWYAWRRTVTG